MDAKNQYANRSSYPVEKCCRKFGRKKICSPRYCKSVAQNTVWCLAKWLCAFMDKTGKWMQKPICKPIIIPVKKCCRKFGRKKICSQGTAKSVAQNTVGALQRWLCAFMDKTEKWMKYQDANLYVKDVAENWKKEDM